MQFYIKNNFKDLLSGTENYNLKFLMMVDFGKSGNKMSITAVWFSGNGMSV